MKSRRLLLLIVLSAAALVIVLIAILSSLAPPTSNVTQTTAEPAAASPCVESASGGCITFPTIVGQAISGVSFTAPADFANRYNIVIVPFDREQQESALSWLAPAQTLSAEFDDLGYYSVAALPDLTPFVRSLVIGGLDLGLQDQAVRAVTVVAFLEEQTRFAEALGLADTSAMAVLLVESGGRVLYRATGDYDSTGEQALREAVLALYS